MMKARPLMRRLTESNFEYCISDSMRLRSVISLQVVSRRPSVRGMIWIWHSLRPFSWDWIEMTVSKRPPSCLFPEIGSSILRIRGR